jgi:2,3-bisphosphoglycerate-dependent phosphoglycerate mutase
MTHTYLTRHGRTRLSEGYLVNGDPRAAVLLDKTGCDQCHHLVTMPWLDSIVTCVTSRFPRARQTADLLLGRRGSQRVVERRLDEVDYGTFEGGPWPRYGEWLDRHGRFARPPGANESLQEATGRLLDGLAASVVLPGPRLVVGHGFMVSIIRSLRERPTSPFAIPRLPEAPYVTPLTLSDDDLVGLLHRAGVEFRSTHADRDGVP